MELRFRKIYKRHKSNILRKLDVKQDRTRRTLQLDYEICLSQVETEYNYLPKFLPRNTGKNFIYNGSFHEAVSKVLLIAEFFAMMPIRGVTAHSANDLSFAWTDVRSIYCLIFLCSTLFDTILTMYKISNSSITFNSIEPLIFRICILIVCCSALNLARKWPTLMTYWQEVEMDLPQYCSQVDKRRMAHSIHSVAFVGMMLSLVEHLLNLISAINFSSFCHTSNDPIKNFFLLAYNELFNVFPYSSVLVIYGNFNNILSVFIWNYMDIFVMIMSIGLSSKFRQLNDNLQTFKGIHMPEAFWSERRIQYRNLCMLCEKIDNAISIITMVSFSNNVYFICVQLLRSLNKMPSLLHAVYFYFSLIFLIGRTLAVSLYSASVYDESRRPLRYLRCVPKESWCPEVKRFTEEINTDLVALSGMNFFHLTRGAILTMAGTIVSYELVLMQFKDDTDLWSCSQLIFP